MGNPLNIKDSMLVKEFFYKKDQELIAKIKQEEAQKVDQAERAPHVGRCTQCGAQTEERSLGEASYRYCSQCSSIHINVADLDSISVHHKMRTLISDLLIERDEQNAKIKKVG